EAALRDVPVLAVCALADTPSILGGARLLEADFEQALVKCEADYPAVVVRRQVVQGAPRGALLDAASGAQLLVVGTRGRGGAARVDARLGEHGSPAPLALPGRRRPRGAVLPLMLPPGAALSGQ